MELPNRDQLEAGYASALATLTNDMRRELVGYLGYPPDPSNVPPEFWDRLRRQTQAEMEGRLYLLWLWSHQYHLELAGDHTDQHTGHAVQHQALEFARHESHEQADLLVERTRTNIAKAGDRWRAIEMELNAPVNGLSPETWRSVPRAEVLKDAASILGPRQVERLAITQTTRAQTAGGDAAMRGTIGTSAEDIWRIHPELSDSGTCPICRPYDGRPRRIWEIEQPLGPGYVHDNCKCTVEYANVGLGQPTLQSVFGESYRESEDTDEKWITINGNHVLNDGDGKVLTGPLKGTTLDGKGKDDGRTDNSKTPAAKTNARAVPNDGRVRGSDERVEPQSSTPVKVSSEPLKGLPSKPVVIEGYGEVKPGPFQTAREAAAAYMAKAGLPYEPVDTYAKVDPARATKIAAEYDKMKHAPDDPKVKAAYGAMIKETLAQYQAIKNTGLKVEFINYEKDGDPYAASPRLATEDVRNNNHLWVFPTSSGFGSDDKFDASKNPLLADSGERISGHKACVNDVFRVVHDYFGHIKEGNGFRADGEENAWRSHSAMYSPEARLAMTSETRGQNSWVNYGPHGEKNRTASSADTVFADQKIGLLPAWCMTDGARESFKEAFCATGAGGEWLKGVQPKAKADKPPRKTHKERAAEIVARVRERRRAEREAKRK